MTENYRACVGRSWGLALSKEDSWFLLTAVRSTDVNRLADGMSQIARHMLRAMLGTHSHPLHHGISLRLEEEQPPQMFVAELGTYQPSSHVCYILS